MKKGDLLYKILTNIFVRNIFIMVVIFFGLVTIVSYCLDSYTKHDEAIFVPNLKGLQIEDANAIVKAAKLNCVVVDSIYLRTGTPGSIIEQTPKDSLKVKGGRTIYLTVVARGQQMVNIPDLQDYSKRQAEALLNSLGFMNISEIPVRSEFKDVVSKIRYMGDTLRAGQKVPAGSPLSIEVGIGGSPEASDNPMTTDSITENVDESIQ